MLKTTLLFFATALCEIVGCYLPWLWLKRGATPLLLIPTALALALFVWLLTLHPAASGRVYAAYGGVYVCTALLWLRVVDGVKLTHYDWAGAAVALCGMLIIVAGWGCGEVIVYAWMDRRRENSEKPYGTRLGAGQAVSARLVGK